MNEVERVEEMFPLDGPHSLELTHQARESMTHLWQFISAAAHPRVAAADPAELIAGSYQDLQMLDHLLRELGALLTGDGPQQHPAVEHLTQTQEALAKVLSPLSAAGAAARQTG